jgi:hypothetical protein
MLSALSIRKWGISRKEVRNERLMTGLQPPDFFGTRKR